MENLVNLMDYPVNNVLGLLLEDKTTKQNIILATDSYLELGPSYTAQSEMTLGTVNGIDPFTLQSRFSKDLADQLKRTKKRAEVFTPSWICNKMNNYCDEDWFGEKNIFNFEEKETWRVNKKKVVFPKNKTWKDYILSRRLEIACGEAPFIISRYDASTGKLLLPPSIRIGVLDRKLRIVNENTNSEEEWLEWVYKSYQSVYGYEFQGDSLLIARVNLLMSFTDYLSARWQRSATESELRKLANIISWNFWQMDGLTGTVPFSAKKDCEQLSLFEDPIEQVELPRILGCKIYDWVANKSQPYETLKG